MTAGPDAAVPLALDAARAELTERVTEAQKRAGRLGRAVLASVSLDVPADLDVSACVLRSRAAEERYFAWEQPEREGFALAGLGSAWTVEGIAGDRFAGAAARCAEALHEAVFEPPTGPPGAGPVWTGGFAFAADGGRKRRWASLPAALLTLAEVSFARMAGSAIATITVACRPGADPAELARRACARLESLRPGAMPLAEPDQHGETEIRSALPPEHYERAVAEAAQRIRAGELEKVVLAREVTVEAAAPFHPGVIFDGLRSEFPSCFSYCVGTPEVAFVGASPELLVRREGASASTVAMAGSTRRSADPAVDDHLGQRLLRSAKDREEHRIVADRVEKALEPLSVWVASADEPSLVKVANIQHLATPVRAQLSQPLSALELAGALHPTPAVGGEPWSRARRVIAELESLDRGWYSGPVGWMDAAEDGELCVALRCALLEGGRAHCYAGVGVVAGSDPEDELAETEVKLQALLPLLSNT